MIPRAFLGSSEDGTIYLCSDGHDDAGTPIDARLRTVPVAPAGADGDCSFDRVYIAVTWSAAATVVCTPLLDGELIEDARFSFTLPRPGDHIRDHQIVERILRRVRKFQGEEVYRYVPRGTWFAFQIEATVESPGDLIVDSVTLDYERLSPTKRLV